MALSDPFATTFAGAYKGGTAFGQALQTIASQYATRKKEERETQRIRGEEERKEQREEKKTKLDEWLSMIKAGYTPAVSEEYTSDDIRGMSIEQMEKIMPRGGFAPGEFPKKKGIITSPTGQIYEPLSGLSKTKLQDLKMFVDLKNAMERNKPTKMQLRKMAQTEASRQLGGTWAVGLREKDREKYRKLSDELYNRYLKNFSVKNSGELEALPIEDLEQEIDWQDINF